MSTVIRNLLLAIFLTGAIAVAKPYLEMALYSARLASLPAPQTLAMPVDGVGRHALRDTWHAPRSGRRRHEGIDIVAPGGTPVRAATEGVVLHVGTNRLGGRVVWVLGPGGQRHYYAHLARFADVFPGQRIAAGTLLGHVGDTGNARGTPPHLHYGIYAGGGAVNPFPLLQGRVESPS
ncbi:M23 family metallopeptidase [Aromatoleum sp.]|uniref:M23 family metallopeptidase n=1 Tax=Aromatoleum sp. TaxID=2307007 RepID=UPI002FCB8DC5